MSLTSYTSTAVGVDSSNRRSVRRRISQMAIASLSAMTVVCGTAHPAIAAEDTSVINNPDDNTRLDPHSDADPNADGFDRFIIGYRDGAKPDIDEILDAGQARAFGRGDGGGRAAEEVAETATGAVVVATDRKLSATEADSFMEAIRANDAVDYIEPDTRMTIMRTPNDKYYPRQWALHGPNGARVNTAWDSVSRADGTVVAVVDSGILPHPDLDDQVLPGYDFISQPWVSRDGDGRDNTPYDEGDWFAPGECGNADGASSSWHGSHVAGIISAGTDNGYGVAGAAPGAQILPVRALGKCGGSTSDISDAIVWAAGGHVQGAPDNAHPADVINLSLGGPGRCSRTYQRAINAAVERGATVVVAAGNEAVDASRVQPANCDNVITVAASGENGSLASYSNYGDTIDVTAPGGDMHTGAGILSTLNTGTQRPGSPAYAFYEGTSMATPLVAGIAALLRAGDPSLSPDDVKQRLVDTARQMPGQCWRGCGAGLVDAAAAVGERGESDTSESVIPAPVDPRPVEFAPEPDSEPVADTPNDPVERPTDRPGVDGETGGDTQQDDVPETDQPSDDTDRPISYRDWLRTLYWLSFYGLRPFGW